jgi:hypothetical protein
MKSLRKSSPAVTPRPETLTFYEVADYGTISDPTVPGPRLRADVFQNISPGFIRTTDDLISEVDGCIPLASHFSILAADHLSGIEDELDEEDNGLGFVERRRLAFLAAALQYDPDTGWRDWIAHEGDPGLAGFREIIQDWLDEDVDWDEADSFDSCWSGQSAAMGFFSDLDAKVLKALSVVIIEGDRPGSSYYAAELRGEIANANQTAQALGLAFRFRAEGEGGAAEPSSSPVVAASKGAGV